MLALAWLWHSGWIGRQVEWALAAGYQLTADAGFAVDQVLVEGRGRTARAAILSALRVQRGTPILAVDPETARNRLEALPWIAQATVERRLPKLLYLRLTERKPLALWQLDGKLSVIDRAGRVIPGVPAKRFARLPLVVGPGAPKQAAALLAMLEREPTLDPAEAWSQLARLEREHGLLARDVVTIDLRLPGRLVVRTAPDAQIGKPLSRAGHNT
jgi:cell division protein FtsQ